ncbi:MAG TPA: rRNA pseudouridine synthase [Actinomycetales bacterium]|nr:rRNA pseudouridine synthase [Actinomycetales bacterium]
MTSPHPEGERLQKVLAHAGLGSRRACEQMIAQGRVEVNGSLVVELGTRVDPTRDEIRVDGSRVVVDDSHLTVALHKPAGVESTMSEESERRTLAEFVGRYNTRLFHVGRLDAPTEGLILLTNDGELAHRLAHPSWEVPKTYLARVRGRVQRGLVRELKAGVELEDGPAAADSVTIREVGPNASIVELVIHDGRNRIVRRMFDAVGHPVEQLVRTQVGPIRLGDLKAGRSRVISGAELRSLMDAVKM